MIAHGSCVGQLRLWEREQAWREVGVCSIRSVVDFSTSADRRSGAGGGAVDLKWSCWLLLRVDCF